MNRAIIAIVLLFTACATPPKPRELVALEQLRAGPEAKHAQKRAPKLTKSADKSLSRSKSRWEDGELEESRRDALMGTIKLKTAIALVEQDRARARAAAGRTELATSEEEYKKLAKELKGVREQVVLLEKLTEERKRAAADQERMSAKLKEEKARTAAEKAIADAKLALKTADTVDAKKHAAADYGAAVDLVTRAESEFVQSSWAAAETSAKLARQKADVALATARPAFQQAKETDAKRAKDEALGRDAAALPGISVRLERQGNATRLVLPLHDLFKRRKTTITSGNEGKLNDVAGLLQKYPDHPVQIVGHTDSRGKSSANLTLSEARAQAVFDALVSRGASPSRFTVTGRGEDQPIADHRSRSGRQQNNRVEVIFQY